MAGIVELKNVSFSAQTQQIVKNFSHIYQEGKTTALVGPSGSGKSTVLKLTAGVLVPTGGEVLFRDRDIFSMTRQENMDFRRESAMVFQDSALWANQNLDQNLELPLKTHFPKMPKKEMDARIKEVLKEVGYKRNLAIRPSALSMGEQKLIGFARALLCRPKVLFLDEWTESLDDSASNRLGQLVRRHKEEGKTVIFVSHKFTHIKNLADYIVMIVEGNLSRVFSREQIENDENLAHYIEDGIAS